MIEPEDQKLLKGKFVIAPSVLKGALYALGSERDHSRKQFETLLDTFNDGITVVKGA